LPSRALTRSGRALIASWPACASSSKGD
jgi:hypothetical protein